MVSVSPGSPPGAALQTAGKLAAEAPECPGVLRPAVNQDLPPAGWGIECQSEPLPAGHPLRTLENVTLSPHLGYVHEENYRIFYRDTVENIAAWLAGKPIRVINS